MNVAESLPILEQDARLKPALVDWVQVEKDLDAHGFAVMRELLTELECRETASLYSSNEWFRSRVVMAKHGFGRGEYKYFSYPLPALIADLRTEIFGPLAGIANHWNQILGLDERYPGDHAAYLERCHDAGQTRPTPLLLEYGPGDFNCLHQDLYGDLVFPLQVAILLSRPGEDFMGGEFVLTEQRPRMQSKTSVVQLRQGDSVVFPVHHRPVRGTRSYYRVNMRHGVSEVRGGRRHTLGLIFHDAW
jgi:uncharacterized protein